MGMAGCTVVSWFVWSMSTWYERHSSCCLSAANNFSSRRSSLSSGRGRRRRCATSASPSPHDPRPEAWLGCEIPARIGEIRWCVTPVAARNRRRLPRRSWKAAPWFWICVCACVAGVCSCECVSPCVCVCMCVSFWSVGELCIGCRCSCLTALARSELVLLAQSTGAAAVAGSLPPCLFQDIYLSMCIE